MCLLSEFWRDFLLVKLWSFLKISSFLITTVLNLNCWNRCEVVGISNVTFPYLPGDWFLRNCCTKIWQRFSSHLQCQMDLTILLLFLVFFFFTLWLGQEIKCPRNRPNTRKKWWGISSFLPTCLFYFCHFILYFIHYILSLLVISTRVIIYSGLPKVAKKWTIKERDRNFFFSHVQSKFWIIHLNFPLFAKNGKLVGKKAKLSYIIFHWNTEIDDKTVTVVRKTKKNKTKQNKKTLNFLASISDLTVFNVNSVSFT